MPNVDIEERNKHSFIPGISPEIAAFVGHFERGPVNVPLFITNTDEFKFFFGRALAAFLNDWYQVYNYLKYSSGIYVTRASGLDNFNANNGSESEDITINQYNDWNSDDITTTDLRVIAKTPGEWGNTLSVGIINKDQYNLNVHVGKGKMAKDLFNFFEDDYYGIIIFKSDELVEVHYKTLQEIDEINTESIYIYIKATSSNIIKYGGSILTFSNGYNSQPTDNDYITAYETLEDTLSYDIDIIIGNQENNNLAIALAETRKDCVAFIGLPSELRLFLEFEDDPRVVNTEDGFALLLESSVFSNKISDAVFNEMILYISSLSNSEYVHFTCNIKRQYDFYTNSIKSLNLAGDIAGLKAEVHETGTWLPSAGLERGIIKNSNGLYLNFSENQKDELYKLGVNTAEGNTMSTQKTFISTESSFSKVHIRSLFNHLEKEVKKIVNHFLFDENNFHIRNNIGVSLKLYIEKIKLERGIQDAKLQVKSLNNSIDISILIKPLYATEFIKLHIINTGNDFTTSIS